MGDPTLRDVLAELATLRAKVEAQERRRRPDHRGRRLLPALLVALLVALTPLALLADDRFGDVPADNPHHDDIALIAAAGIKMFGRYVDDAYNRLAASVPSV